MTHHEYQEMLRAALEAHQQVEDAREQNLSSRAIYDYSRKADALRVAALATPPPSSKLRPMKDAPRDGSSILVYVNGGGNHIRYWEIAAFLDSAEGWVDDNYQKLNCIGWLPLPEVGE